MSQSLCTHLQPSFQIKYLEPSSFRVENSRSHSPTARPQRTGRLSELISGMSVSLG